MIIEYLRYTIDVDRHAGFIEGYKQASVPLMQSEYCKQYEFSQCVEEPTKFIIRIQWTSAEDHLKRFRRSEEFKKFFVHIKPYLNDIDEMRHYELLN